MAHDLSTTIELLREINTHLSDELLQTNKRLKLLQDTLNDVSSNAQPNIEELQQQIETLTAQVEQLTIENRKYKDLLKNQEMNDIADLNTALQTLLHNIENLYGQETIIYTKADEAVSNFNIFRSIIEEGIENNYEQIKDFIRNQLVETIETSGWANSLIRIGEFSKLENFKFPLIKDDLFRMSKLILDLHIKYGVQLNIPNLLKEKYDSSLYDYSNTNTLWIDNFCELTTIDHIGYIYDVHMIGYTITSDDGVTKKRKPIVFSYF